MTEAVSYRSWSIDLLYKSMDWFLYDNGLRHERVSSIFQVLWLKSGNVWFKANDLQWGMQVIRIL